MTNFPSSITRNTGTSATLDYDYVPVPYFPKSRSIAPLPPDQTSLYHNVIFEIKIIITPDLNMFSFRSVLLLLALVIAVSAGTNKEGLAFLSKKAAEEG